MTGFAGAKRARRSAIQRRGDLSEPGSLSEDVVPSFPHGVRLRFDETREKWVLLAPERVLKLDGIAAEIVKLVDGARTIAAIVDDLNGRFDVGRDQISQDVRAFLVQLAAKRMLEV